MTPQPTEVPGWRALVDKVSAASIYIEDDIVGAPLAWSLNERRADGRIVAVADICCVTGQEVSGNVPVIREPGREPRHDLSAWGVRCARCHRPVHCQHAGMVTAVDVPSCPECRRAVRLQILGIAEI